MPCKLLPILYSREWHVAIVHPAKRNCQAFALKQFFGWFGDFWKHDVCVNDAVDFASVSTNGIDTLLQCGELVERRPGRPKLFRNEELAVWRK
jgi:hypothetical protein